MTAEEKTNAKQIAALQQSHFADEISKLEKTINTDYAQVLT